MTPHGPPDRGDRPDTDPLESWSAVDPRRIELIPAAEIRPPRPVRAEPVRPRWGLALLLFGLTLATTTTMGAVWVLYTSTRVMTDLSPLLSPRTVVEVWSDPEILSLGLTFSLPALFILLCHELGHYLACRYYRLPATLPYFLPLPLALGTLGAFIRIRAVIRTKRELFDVGVAGPLAGFVALIPFLVLGVLWSEPVTAVNLPEGVYGTLLVPGDSLALSGLTHAFHGSLGDDRILQLHPFALAAWFGLLATSLNLIPLGQLDGGHILYAALGRVQRRLAFPLWLGLLAVALLVWPGWGLWCVVTLVMGLRHPPVYDEQARLDPVRKALAWAALAVFLLSFMPVPLMEVLIAP
jgi:membrane-associated protease RseP (regulator of RpoE activity)